MSSKLTLAAERRRRQAAEAEVTRLRAQLDALKAAASQGANSQPTAERPLAEQQDLVSQVIDASPNIVYVDDEYGQCILANKSYQQLLIQQAGEELRDSVLEISAHSPDLHTASTSFEECYHLKDGQTVWYHTTKSPLIRSDGSRYLITFSSNITELKQAQRVAEESIRAREIFLANISHEIRTPLHGVMGLAALLKRETLSEESTNYVAMIQSSTENLLVIINDILDFAKTESGQIRLETIPFDIHKIVRDAVRSLAFKIDEKELQLRIIGLDESLPMALGDPFRLYQVLVNLLSNAIKFTSHGSITITIDASKREGMQLPVTFSVADTGIGISADSLDAVFNSFQQANSSIPRLYGGTGLGLSICKNLVELQGGEIGVRSEPGQGSSFYFTIPYLATEELPFQEPDGIQQPNLLQGLTVLLAEDNNINQRIAISMLSQWQVKVYVAHNGEDALTKAYKQKYDLILMDVQMPLLDGIEVTARLQATPGPNQHTPIIAITADAIKVGASSCQALGFTNYLIKPYHELALYKMLTQISQQAKAAPAKAPQSAPAAAVPAKPQRPPYDFSMFGRLATDKEFIHKLLTLFIDQVPRQVQALETAVEHDNWLAAAQEAHILKTTFGSLNIEPETSYLKQLEHLAGLKPSKSQLQPLAAAVAKGTPLYVSLFTKELAKVL